MLQKDKRNWNSHLTIQVICILICVASLGLIFYTNCPQDNFTVIKNITVKSSDSDIHIKWEHCTIGINDKVIVTIMISNKDIVMRKEVNAIWGGTF